MKETLKVMFLCVALGAALAACGGGGDDKDAATDASVDPPAEEASTNDGYPKNLPYVSGTWTGCPAAPTPGDNVTVHMVLEDFQEDYPVEGATIEVYLGNVIDESPDFTLGPTDEDGKTGDFSAPKNSLIAYRVQASNTLPFPPGEIRTSIEYSVPIPDGGGKVDALAVSRSTYLLIPTVFGLYPSASLGILAGSFQDCSMTEIEGIVARLYASGSAAPCKDEAASKCLDKYFIDETPARDQFWSSEDGLFGILEVPAGSGYRLELHGRISGSACPGEMEMLVKAENITVVPDSINILDLDASAGDTHTCVW